MPSAAIRVKISSPIAFLCRITIVAEIWPIMFVHRSNPISFVKMDVFLHISLLRQYQKDEAC